MGYDTFTKFNFVGGFRGKGQGATHPYDASIYGKYEIMS